MKRLFVASVVVAMAFAWNANAQISVGVGYANESVVSKESVKFPDDYKGYGWEKSRMKLNGFYIEASYNWDLAKVGPGTFALQPGIRYSCFTDLSASGRLRVRYTDDDDIYMKFTGTSKNRRSDHLIDVPVHVKYAYDVVPGSVRAYAFAGPVLSFGLAAMNVESASQKLVYDGDVEKIQEVERYNAYTGSYYYKAYDESSEKHEIEKGTDDKYRAYNMFDLKLALGLGVTVARKVDIKFGYNIGLLNRSFVKNTEDLKYSTHSNILYFGAAYNF